MAEPFEIDADPRETLPVRLVGVLYDVHPPKMSFTLKLAARADEFEDSPRETQDMIQEWIGAAFDADTQDSILARLEDPVDDLDVVHIMKLMEHIVEEQTGNPTMSPSVSAASRSATGRTSTVSRSAKTSRR